MKLYKVTELPKKIRKKVVDRNREDIYCDSLEKFTPETNKEVEDALMEAEIFFDEDGNYVDLPKRSSRPRIHKMPGQIGGF